MDQPAFVDTPAPPARCAVCDAELRPAVMGRPARYCNTACRSAAYRRRRAEAAALSGPRAHLLGLADSIRAATLDYLDALDRHGDDPEAVDRALAVLRATAPLYGRQLLDQAALARPGHADGTSPASPGADGGGREPRGARTHTALPAGSAASGPRSGVRRIDGGTAPGAPAPTPRGYDEAAGAGAPPAAAQSEPAQLPPPAQPPALRAVGAGNRRPGGPGRVARTSTTAPRLALAEQRLPAIAPTQRGLGEAERSHRLGGGLVLLSWPQAPGVRAVELCGRLLGWIEEGVVFPPEAWVALVDGRLVIDADDALPLLSTEPADALTLLGLAAQQHLT